MELNTDEINSIFQRYDIDGDGKLEYNEFIKLVDFSKGQFGGAEKTISKQLVAETNDIILMIRRQLKVELGPGAKSGRVIKEVFGEMDKNGDNSLDKAEFIRAMKKLNIELTPRDVDAIFERFDEDKDDTIDYSEFLLILDFEGSKKKVHENTISAQMSKETPHIDPRRAREVEPRS